MRTMKLPLPLAVLLTIGASGAVASLPDPAKLPRSAPEAQGISSNAIREFVEAADTQIDTMNSFMLVRHGHVVAEAWWAPYTAEAPHTFYSLTKSFTSTAVGFAVAEGKLSIDDTVVSFFPDAVPADASGHLKAMRIRDLLTMSTGHHADTITDFFDAGLNDLPRRFLALPVAHKPGTHFVYNTPASQMLSEIVQKATGEKLADYLRPRLLDPLGIHGLHWAGTTDGVSLGGYGIAGRTEDIAKFGLLYLQKGEWQGRRLLPASWIEVATARQTSNGSQPTSDWDQGYGFQFWRTRHGLYRGDGAFGQYCIVFPEHDAVVAITSGVRNMQAVMNLLWEKILPALGPAALPTDDSAARALESTLASLSVARPTGSATSSIADRVSVKPYTLPSNAAEFEAVAFEFDHDHTSLTFTRNGEAHRINVGTTDWLGGVTSLFPQLSHDPLARATQPYAATGAWVDETTYTAKIVLTETPFYLTVKCRFGGKLVVLDVEQNVAFGPTKHPQLVGEQE